MLSGITKAENDLEKAVNSIANKETKFKNLDNQKDKTWKNNQIYKNDVFSKTAKRHKSIVKNLHKVSNLIQSTNL